MVMLLKLQGIKFLPSGISKLAQIIIEHNVDGRQQSEVPSHTIAS